MSTQQFVKGHRMNLKLGAVGNLTMNKGDGHAVLNTSHYRDVMYSSPQHTFIHSVLLSFNQGLKTAEGE